MKCPKCSYFGLDSGDRCKNCGYEFSLIEDGAGHTGPSHVRARATPLNPPSNPRPDPVRLRAARPSHDRAALDGALHRPLERTPDSAPLDLPLFDAEFPPGAPLPPPQRPLGVRRAGSVTPRVRTVQERHDPGALPLEPEGGAMPAPPPATPECHATTDAVPVHDPPASASRRVGAWVVDICLVVLVDVATLYFTLRLCGLEPAEWDILPVWPLATFFLIVNGGYVVLLTATLGQTLGKMAVRIEVVADGHPVVGIGRATLRTLAAVLSLVPVGLGFVWALLGDRRALHDRLTGTRVVQLTLS